MEEWSDWTVDNDPAEMVRQMRSVLADRQRSHTDKVEALTLLTNLADEDSIAVLRWYNEHADAGMEVVAMLALMEANRLNRPPAIEPWHDEMVERIHELGERLTVSLGAPPDRATFRAALVTELRDVGFQVEEGNRALLKYEGQLIDLALLDIVVNNHVLIGFWDQEDEERALEEFAENYDEEEEEPDPMDRFYSTLRAANLPWGIQVDTSGGSVLTDIVANIEVDRGTPRVEYILAVPRP